MNWDAFLSEELHLHILSAGRLAKIEHPDSWIPRGSRPHCRFFYIVSGQMRFTMPDGRELLTSAGDVIYLPGDCEYRGHWMGDGSHATVHFTLTDAAGARIKPAREITLVHHDDGRALTTLLAMCDAWKSDEAGWQLRLKSSFYAFVNCLLTGARPEAKAAEESAIRRAVLTLEDSILPDAPAVRTAELARRSAMCESEFRRLFKQETGMPPQRYKNWLRVKKARELIEAGAPVSRAAEAVGFSDMVYFNKLFHQFYGIAPREAKK